MNKIRQAIISAKEQDSPFAEIARTIENVTGVCMSGTLLHRWVNEGYEPKDKRIRGALGLQNLDYRDLWQLSDKELSWIIENRREF